MKNIRIFEWLEYEGYRPTRVNPNTITFNANTLGYTIIEIDNYLVLLLQNIHECRAMEYVNNLIACNKLNESRISVKAVITSENIVSLVIETSDTTEGFIKNFEKYIANMDAAVKEFLSSSSLTSTFLENSTHRTLN